MHLETRRLYYLLFNVPQLWTAVPNLLFVKGTVAVYVFLKSLLIGFILFLKQISRLMFCTQENKLALKPPHWDL